MKWYFIDSPQKQFQGTIPRTCCYAVVSHSHSHPHFQPILEINYQYLPSEGERHQHQWAEHRSERPERKVSAAKLSSSVRSSLCCDLMPPSVHNFVHFTQPTTVEVKRYIKIKATQNNWQSARNSHRKQTNKRDSYYTMERPTSTDVLVVKVKDRRSTLSHVN